MTDNPADNTDDIKDGIEGAISDPDGVAESAKDAAAAAKDKLTGKGAAAAAGAAGLAGSLKGKASDLLGGDTPDVDAPDMPDVKSKGGSLKDRAAAAKANLADSAGSMKDKAAGAAAGAADSAKGAVSGATDGVKGAASGVTGGVAGAAAGATGAAAGVAGSMKDKAAGAAAGAADSAKGAVSGATDGVKGVAGGVTGGVTDVAGSMKDKAAGAAGGVTGSVKGAAAGATAGVAGVAASASDKVSAAASGVTETVTTTTTSASASAPVDTARSGGSGSGGSGGGDDDDEGGFFPELPISGEWQIIGLGLLVATFFLFGSSIWGFFTGDDELVDGVVLTESSELDPLCADLYDDLRASDLDEDAYEGLRCSVEDGEAFLQGEVASETDRIAVAAAVAAASVEAGSRLTVPEVEEVEEVAAPETTTTTAAPETTTTTAAPETTTTTEAETTTTTTEAAPEPTNMWDAMNDSGQAGQFAAIGGALGLQASLEGTEPAQRTLFAPSDAALAQLDPATINAIASDPDRANALVGYHILPDALSADDLIALDGQSIDSITGLPLDITVVDGEVVINGTSRVVATDFTADNGTVHIIETILTPPTVNALLDLENIEFEVNSAVITATGQAELAKAVEYFSANESNAEIQGHTDTDGGDEDNLTLSQARAEAVVAFLAENGLDAARFTPVGFGESQPILVDGVEDKAASRRIEFQLR